MLKFLSALILAGLFALPSHAGPFNIGRAALPDEIAAWDIDIRPDGQGLPVGSGSVLDGEEVFTDQCAGCHGDFGEAVGRWPALAGGHGTLADERPTKTIGSYWPYLSTAWDYIYRTMPYGNAQSLKPDEVYQLVAYILYLNDEVEEDFILSNENFADFKMTNENGFRFDDRPETEYRTFSKNACMSDCKTVVVVTDSATPDAEPSQDADGVTKISFQPSFQLYDVELARKGAEVFNKCKACHRIGRGARNSFGPVLNDMFDRRAGDVQGFRYSKGMLQFRAFGGAWSEASLDAYLTDPKGFIPKTKMVFVGLKEVEDRNAVIEFMKTISQ